MGRAAMGRQFRRILRVRHGLVPSGLVSQGAYVFLSYVNQQWPYNPQVPHGAWEFHEHLIPASPVKPLRIWMEVADRDLLNPNAMRDDMHDWVIANENMARVLAAKGYHYQFVFSRNSGHDSSAKRQTLPEALEYLWRDYPRSK